MISFGHNRRELRRSWTAVAERSGDTAFRSAAKAAWRFASRRSPKALAAAPPRCAVSPIYRRHDTGKLQAARTKRNPAEFYSAVRQSGTPITKMKTLALCATIVAVAAWFGWVRHHQVTELRRQNIELRASADEVLRYHSESAELEQETIDTNELQRLRAERSELMKLRSAIGRLRRTAKIELPQIQRQVEAMVTQTADVQQRASGILAERAAKQISKLTREFLGDLNSSVWIVAKANGGRFPTSLAEMEMIWRALPEERRTRYVRDEAGTFLNVLVRTNHLSPRETELTGASFSVSARSFEFMRFERPLNTKDPPVPFIRETTPRQFPNGKFARYYGFTDGRVAEAVVGDGNFTQWEREPPQAEDSKMN